MFLLVAAGIGTLPLRWTNFVASATRSPAGLLQVFADQRFRLVPPVPAVSGVTGIAASVEETREDRERGPSGLPQLIQCQVIVPTQRTDARAARPSGCRGRR
jgi:hypothetical protein